MPRKPTTAATRILAAIAGRNPRRRQAFNEEVANREVARKIYELPRMPTCPRANWPAGSAPPSP